MDSGDNLIASEMLYFKLSPFSQWKNDQLDEVTRALDSPPIADTTLGLYIHIPFCRKRCKFCYFKVFTDQNAKEIEKYVSALMSRN